MSEQNQYKPGDVVNGHVLTSDGTWQPLGTTPAPPIPPVPPTPPVWNAEPEQPQRRKKRLWLWIPLGIVGAFVLLVVAIGIAGGGSKDDAPAAASGGASAGDASSDAGSGSADLSAYTPVDEATWAQVAKNPDAERGRKIVVFAEVTQFDSATGDSAFRANVGANQPAGEYELDTNVILEGDAAMLAHVTQGDVLKVYADVAGSFEYETMVGGATTVPALDVVAVEVVGYLDITGDAQLGAPVWGEYGGVEVPVTITNSAGVTMSYSVDVVAETADGSQQLGTAYAYAENLAPGQSAATEASFFEDLPADAVIKVVAVERHNY